MPAWRSWRPSRLMRSAARAAVALTLALVLVFIRNFDNLEARPVALNSTILVIIVGEAGKTVGGCIEQILLSTVGLGLGCLVFFILGELGKANAPVGQAFIFALFVYGCALIRAKGATYISFYLIAVLYSFNGIYYTSGPEVGSPSSDIDQWQLAFFEAYAWGIAITITCNVLLWPLTSERELRDLLVQSLQHVSTLSHLTCKVFAKQIDPNEKEVRDLLVQSIRADFSALTTRLEEASYEVVYTRWALKDYRAMIEHVRGLQQALITSSSLLDLIDTLDPEGVNVQKYLLAKAEAAATFVQFRRGIDLVISEIIDELHGTKRAARNILDDLDLEARQQAVAVKPPLQASKQLADVSARLQAEVLNASTRQRRIRLDSAVRPLPNFDSAHPPMTTATPPPESNAGGSTLPSTRTNSAVHSVSTVIFRQAWEKFSRVQTEAIITLIKDGSLQVEDVLRIEGAMPSLQTMYAERLPKSWTSSLVDDTPLNRRKSRLSGATSQKPTLGDADSLGEEVEEVPCSEALTKSYSLLFALGQLTDELLDLHQLACSSKKKQLRFHILERSDATTNKDSMELQEALAALRGTTWSAPRVPLIRRLMTLEKWLRCDRSLYALKVATGATIYLVLLLAHGPRSVFIRFGMTSSLITVIVAISPSLGQTLFTFILQLLGTGVGSIFGLVTLLVFRNVGGYKYNPYGITVFMGIWFACASYLFYKNRRYYTGALLLVTGAGGVVIQEWLYNEDPAVESPFPTPEYRAAYSIASMCISIAIAAFFQILVFRSPARRQLRLRIADVTYGLSAYNTLLQANINASAPADSAPVPPPAALAKIQRDLIKRESKLQAQIIALGPMYEFAKVEPKFAVPFQGEVLLNIIQCHQVILDRLREARTAVGTTGFNDTVHKDFASKLFPYRLHSQRLSRTLFYLTATSLVSKTPLPRDVPSSIPTWASFENDALVLSKRLGQRPHGDKELRDPGYLRYWFYLCSLGSVARALEDLEMYLGVLFGLPENHPAIR